jgi:lysophospholipase L1-like esterase
MTKAADEAGHSRSWVMPVIRRVIPGVGRVHAQTAPYAEAWRAANDLALGSDGPLWVALGDSMSQGIGARSFEGGWVGQLRDRLAADGRAHRVVNLSVTGARVRDVIDHQLPQLRALGVEPDLVTVLIGANDMLFRRRRAAAVGAFGELIDQLPARRTVMGLLPQRSPESVAINRLISAARDAGRLRATEVFTGGWSDIRGTLAEDFFHPNERGYGQIADAFEQALAD